MYAGATIPSNYMLCDGRELSKADYPQLFQAIGTIYGESADKLKFKIPDLRGKFVRCVGGNSAPLGIEQGDAIRNITASVSSDPSVNGNAAPTISSGGLSENGAFRAINYASKASAGGIYPGTGYYGISFDASRVVPTANENRPINMSMNFIIQVEE